MLFNINSEVENINRNNKSPGAQTPRLKIKQLGCLTESCGFSGKHSRFAVERQVCVHVPIVEGR